MHSIRASAPQNIGGKHKHFLLELAWQKVMQAFFLEEKIALNMKCIVSNFLQILYESLRKLIFEVFFLISQAKTQLRASLCACLMPCLIKLFLERFL